MGRREGSCCCPDLQDRKTTELGSSWHQLKTPAESQHYPLANSPHKSLREERADPFCLAHSTPEVPKGEQLPVWSSCFGQCLLTVTIPEAIKSLKEKVSWAHGFRGLLNLSSHSKAAWCPCFGLAVGQYSLAKAVDRAKVTFHEKELRKRDKKPLVSFKDTPLITRGPPTKSCILNFLPPPNNTQVTKTLIHEPLRHILSLSYSNTPRGNRGLWCVVASKNCLGQIFSFFNSSLLVSSCSIALYVGSKVERLPFAWHWSRFLRRTWRNMCDKFMNEYDLSEGAIHHW